MKTRKPWRLAGLVLAGVTGSVLLFRVMVPSPSRALPSDAYIWQRIWTESVAGAVTDSSSYIGQWHVLAAERDARMQWHDTYPGPVPAVMKNRPALAVIRLSGLRDTGDVRDVLTHLTALRARWQALGLTFGGVEIDHDCPVSGLDTYASFLLRVRQGLLPGERLTITALPAWIGAGGLPAVLAVPDDVVLQLHSVQNPVSGLFSPASALRAARSFSHVRHGRWKIALPSYGSRIVWGEHGLIAQIESETPQGTESDQGQEIMPDPVVVANFMKQVEAESMSGLTGWIWFRLPVAGDRRSWSLAGWLEVVAHRPTTVILKTEVTTEENGLHTVLITNAGHVDTFLPRQINLVTDCIGMGSLDPYRLDQQGEQASLVRTQAQLIPVAQRRTVAWLRCEKERPEIDVTY